MFWAFPIQQMFEKIIEISTLHSSVQFPPLIFGMTLTTLTKHRLYFFGWTFLFHSTLFLIAFFLPVIISGHDGSHTSAAGHFPAPMNCKCLWQKRVYPDVTPIQKFSIKSLSPGCDRNGGSFIFIGSVRNIWFGLWSFWVYYFELV